jgi:diguanylate cyclase (GGDEF)-like protein/PAS domain S-box-containing protein
MSPLQWLRRQHLPWALDPVARISLGLISLLVGLLMVLDLALQLLPDQRAATQSVREQVAMNLALQVRAMLGEPRMRPTLAAMLGEITAQSNELSSIGVRQNSGALLLSTSQHAQAWQAPPLGLSTLTSVVIPLYTSAGRWGQLEVGYKPPWPETLLGWLTQPTPRLVGMLSLSAFVAFNLYLRRVLQHLDPSKAIPERVRVAFDTLSEGLLVLDPKGQILLANAAFRRLQPQGDEALMGRQIEQLQWLSRGLHEADEMAPWVRALHTSEPLLGIEVDLSHGRSEPRRAQLNCTAIRDAAGNPRGCLLTLNDVTALDQANASLRGALAELHASRDQIQKQNEELQLLASSDPMTGCFNRRAFYARAEPMLLQALSRNEVLCCVMTDIDRFKLVNDTHGHGVGDLVIQAVAKVLKTSMRDVDVLCRYGGEEFCIILRGLTLAQAMAVADRIRERVEREVGPSITEVPNMRVTSSFGVAQLGMGDARTLSRLIERADQGLYAAKEAGRNQVQCIDRTPPAAAKVNSQAAQAH